MVFTSSRYLVPFILFILFILFITCVLGLGVMFLIGAVRLTCASGHKKSEVEFQLCRCAFLEWGCTEVQTWPGPARAAQRSQSWSPVGPVSTMQYISTP